MKDFSVGFLTLLLCITPALMFDVHGQLKPAQIFTDHMVLQRNTPVPVWGHAEPGETVSVLLNSNRVKGTTDTAGIWSLKISPMSAGGPYDMEIRSKTDTLIFRDVMIGEVWFASGQSNMEHALGGWPWIPHSQIKDYDKEIKDTGHPNIRMFNVPKLASPLELKVLKSGTWELPTAGTLPNFSATAWFFAKDLQKSLKVPIGIIHSSWGGTSIAPWMDPSSLEPFKDSIPLPSLPIGFNEKKWGVQMDSTWAMHVARRNQISYSGLENVKSLSSLDQSGIPWKPLDQISELIATSKNWIWLRTEISLPDDYENSKWSLSLGRLNRQTHIFLNGEGLGYFLYPKEVRTELPIDLLHKDTNVLLVRIAQPWGAPEVEGKRFALENMDGSFRIDLSKKWRALVPSEPVIPPAETHSGRPTYLFNGMVAPIIPYAIKGFIWHQGSSDVGRPEFYEKAFPALISGWRKQWGMGSKPFIFVQLPNYRSAWKQSEKSVSRASLRQAQSAALTLPNTAMVVSFDIGNPNDVHPANKQDFGQRLALQALSKVYGREINADGPRYLSHKIERNTLVIALSSKEGRLTSIPKTDICGFELAGKDGKFRVARAALQGHQVYLTSEKVASPKEARYAWSDDPGCFIYGPEGLPLAPFWIKN